MQWQRPPHNVLKCQQVRSDEPCTILLYFLMVIVSGHIYPGYFSAEAGKSVASYSLCPPGTYSNSGAWTCILCGVGTFNSLAGATSCAVCPTMPCQSGYGSSCNTTGSLSCQQCPAGQYSAGSRCVACRAGFYSSPGASGCYVCPAGRYTNSGDALCSLCSAGTYSVAGICISCPAGSYSALASSSCAVCPAGTYSNSGWGECNLCPTGTYSALPGGTTSSSCSSCPTSSYASGSAVCPPTVMRGE